VSVTTLASPWGVKVQWTAPISHAVNYTPIVLICRYDEQDDGWAYLSTESKQGIVGYPARVLADDHGDAEHIVSV
jgi:hypothetical protein